MASSVYVVLACLALVTLGLTLNATVRLPRVLERRLSQSLQAFARAIELRCPQREGQAERIGSLALALGERMGLSAKSVRRLSRSASLTDIGLCAVPYAQINSRPRDLWTDTDHEAFRRHPQIAAAMIELTPSLRELAPIIRCHHVRFDGRSGPEFPSRDGLPIESRILKLVSDFVDLERAMGSTLAASHLKASEGTHYDPELVDRFLAMLTFTRDGDPAALILA